MAKQWEISQDAFDRFLAWLDPNREQAGIKYEEIRCRLIKIFKCRGSIAGEELADETINRVIRRMQELASSYTGDPALYFYGVARHVLREHVKKPPIIPPPPLPDPPEQKELEHRCLEACMAALAPENRQLMLEYYKEERHAKIVHRKELAARMGIAPNALRIRAYRTRAALQVCVEKCIQKGLR